MDHRANTLPIIDLEGLAEGDEAALRRIAAEVRQAFTTVGFCYVVNHGVEDVVIAEAAGAALDFFHRPLDTKLKAAPLHAVRGFNAIGRTTMYGAAHPDHKEYFQIGLDLGPDDPDVRAGEPLRGANRWPEDAPAFRAALSAYFDAIGACGRRFLRAVAASLGAAPDFFESRYAKPLQRTQCVYYPPHPADADPDLFGVAPHTDYGCVTLLWQDDVGGLEVRDVNGGWRPAPPLAGSLVVNIGDLLARWSNDRYRSNFHRVTNRSGRERLSIATFFDPDFKAVVSTADFAAPGEAAKYEPVRAGDYIMGRIGASQQRRQEQR